jgi:hypothetical protein
MERCARRWMAELRSGLDITGQSTHQSYSFSGFIYVQSLCRLAEEVLTLTAAWAGRRGWASQEGMRSDLRQALHGPAVGMGGGGDSGSERASNGGAAKAAGRWAGGAVIGEDLLQTLSKAVSEAVGARVENMVEVSGDNCRMIVFLRTE